MYCPSETPAGTLILIVDSPCSRPSPLQVGHFSFMIWPVPPQYVQAAILTNWPNMERDTCRSSPVPLHCGHVDFPEPERAPLPLQVPHVFLFLFFFFSSPPSAISSSVSFKRMRRSEPGSPVERGPRRDCVPP